MPWQIILLWLDLKNLFNTALAKLLDVVDYQGELHSRLEPFNKKIITNQIFDPEKLQILTIWQFKCMKVICFIKISIILL